MRVFPNQIIISYRIDPDCNRWSQSYEKFVIKTLFFFFCYLPFCFTWYDEDQNLGFKLQCLHDESVSKTWFETERWVQSHYLLLSIKRKKDLSEWIQEMHLKSMLLFAFWTSREPSGNSSFFTLNQSLFSKLKVFCHGNVMFSETTSNRKRSKRASLVP